MPRMNNILFYQFTDWNAHLCHDNENLRDCSQKHHQQSGGIFCQLVDDIICEVSCLHQLKTKSLNRMTTLRPSNHKPLSLKQEKKTIVEIINLNGL